MKEKLFIVIPAYNEEANIATVAREWHKTLENVCGDSTDTEGHLVIANDGSKDSTLLILKQLTEELPMLEVLDKPNSGHGATLLHLYNYAISNAADYIFQTDSDGQTLPSEFLAFWNDRANYDFIIGTRHNRQDGMSRRIVTKVLKIVVRICFKVSVDDANTPYRLMNAEVLAGILPYIPDRFNLSNVAISAIAVKQSCNISWRPITFRPRQGGVNSINIRKIFKIGAQSVKDFKTINSNLK